MRATLSTSISWLFYDNGNHRHKFAAILNHLNFWNAAPSRSTGGFDSSRSLGLLPVTSKGFYVIELKSPLSIEQFLKHAVYSSLLEQKISEPAVDALKPAGLQGLQDLSKRFRMSLPMSVWLKSLCLKSSLKIHLI